MPAAQRAEQFLELAAITALCALYVVHFGVVCLNAVDVPFNDEWMLISSVSSPHAFDLGWLWAPHNGHHIVPTKVQVWLLYRLGGWNIRSHQLLNFAVYGFTVATILFASLRFRVAAPRALLAVGGLFLLSTTCYMNHSFAMQSCFHFFLLFFFAAALGWFDVRQRWSRILLGTAAGAWCVASLGAGAPACVALLATYSVYKLGRARRMDGRARRREIMQWAAAASLVVVIVLALPAETVEARGTPFAASLDHLNVSARLFVNLVSWGFGVERFSAELGALCLAWVAVHLAAALARARVGDDPRSWAVLGLTAGILAVLGSIAVMRAKVVWLIGPAMVAKAPRYGEIAFALVPLTLLLVDHACVDRPKAFRVWAWSATVLLAVVGFRNDFRFDLYAKRHDQLEDGLRCVAAYYRSPGGVPDCPDIWQFEVFEKEFGPLQPKLETARMLDLSFVRTLALPHAPTSLATAAPR